VFALIATRHIALLSPAVGTGNVGDHFIDAAIRRLLRDDVVYHSFSIRRPLVASDIEQINGTSCALICGTNLYQHDWESALTTTNLERIKVPVIPFGVGSSAAKLDDTLVSDETRTMIRAIHERCVLGGVRDNHAAQVVDRAGVKNVIVTGCPVLFWAGAASFPRITSRPRRKLILTARNWLMHRWPDNVDHPVQIELLRRALSEFGERPYAFAVHEDFDRSLVELLKIPSAAVLDSKDWREYERLYTDPDNVALALRLHAGMLARANGLPAVFVGHDARTYAFCRLLGIECIDLFAPDCADRCIQLLERALNGETAHEDRAAEVFAQLHAAMHRFLAANELPINPRWQA
jgi:polysaccharide pyruvyl transferase WcaK-like protein